MRPVVDIHTSLKKHMVRHSPDPQAMTETEDKVALSLGKEAPICVGTSFLVHQPSNGTMQTV